MDRRKFITSAAAVGAAGLMSNALTRAAQAETAKSSDINHDLTGVWTDPYLRQPTSIIIECDASGSNVTVTGTYWHKDHGQCTFQGTGELKGNKLSLNYSHSTKKEMGEGVVNMELAKIDNTFVLKGSAKKGDESWSCNNMSWYKVRR